MVNAKIISNVARYMNTHYKDTEGEIKEYIESLVVDYKLNTKIKYWCDIREFIVNTLGYSHFILDIPQDWLDDRDKQVREKLKTREYFELDKEKILEFMDYECISYNPDHEFIRLLIISGRRGAEILESEFKIEENELWYIPLKKKTNDWYRIEHLLFGYTPEMFMDDLKKLRKSYLKYNSFSAIKYTLIAYFKRWFGYTKLHACRSMYIMFCIERVRVNDKKIQPNTLVYNVCEWLCHDTINSSQRYLQCKWKE